MPRFSCRPAALALLALAGTLPASLAAQRVSDTSRREAADSQLARATRAMRVRNFDAAVRAADSARALDPGRSRVQLVYGQAYLSHARDRPTLGALKKVKAGRAALERAIELDPDNLDARHTLMQFLLQAPGFVGGSRSGARTQAAEIGRRDRARGLLARLEVARSGKDQDEIEAVYRDAIAVMGGPADSSATLMGAFLMAAAEMRSKRLGETLTDRVYAAHPEHPVAVYHRARLWVIRRERPAEAERLLLRYLAGPEVRSGAASRAGAHWRLGQLYERLDREGDARERYRLAARLDDRLEPGKRIPKRLESEI